MVRENWTTTRARRKARPRAPDEGAAFRTRAGRNADRKNAGIASGDDRRHEGESGQAREEPAAPEEVEAELFGGQVVEGGEQELRQAQAQGQGDEDEQDRFAVELADDVGPARPGDLAHADFAGPAGRAGRRQVHEVDAGDEQDEKGHQGEDADIADVAVGRVELVVRVKVDPFQGLEGETRPFLDRRLVAEIAGDLPDRGVGREFPFEAGRRS